MGREDAAEQLGRGSKVPSLLPCSSLKRRKHFKKPGYSERPDSFEQDSRPGRRESERSSGLGLSAALTPLEGDPGPACRGKGGGAGDFTPRGMGWDGCPCPRARRAQDPTRSQALVGSTFHPGRGATPQGLTRRSGSRAAWLSAVWKGKESSSRSQSFVLLAVLVLKGGQPSTVSSLENAVLISSCLCPFLLAAGRAPGSRTACCGRPAPATPHTSAQGLGRRPTP